MTLTTGQSSTPSASTCSIAHRPHGSSFRNGPKRNLSSKNAFALLWSLSVHDKEALDESFRKCLRFIERGAEDDRNFVKKAVNMALRAIGKRNVALNAAAIEAAQRLAKSDSRAAQWVGNDAIKELTSPAVTRRLTAKHRAVRRG